MPWLNIAEVETALDLAATNYPSFTQFITLPNPTWEGRICHAVRIGRPAAAKPAIFFLGCVHAREWGSADILVNFINEIQAAYQDATSITFGTRTFTRAQIQDIVDTLDIIVFPQANPDGRNESMTGNAMWRKNRRVAAPNSNMCPGVDINRNFEFLWDFVTHFNPASAVSASNDPCDPEVYCGPSAFSEPETRNVKWMFDTFPEIGAFVDLHSHGERIYYSWGDDESQAADPAMNFRNAAYDGQRGISSDFYAEYLPSWDRAEAVALAIAMKNAIEDVRGTVYTTEASFRLYPTSGASDDYAYSRHFVDATKKNVIAYTLEWGTQFQPPYAEMASIIPEITCGLLALCLELCNKENVMAWQTSGNGATDPATDFLGTTDNEPVVVKTNGSEALRISPTGNVGIGTDAPQEKLHVAGSAIISGVAVGADVPGINYIYAYETVGVANTAMNLRLQSPNAIVCHTGSPTPTPRLTINGNGEVRMEKRLTAVGGVIATGVAVGTDVPGLTYNYAYETIGVANTAMNLRLQSPNGILFHTGAATPTERVMIDANGRVGIGTVAPATKLTVVEDSAQGFGVLSDSIGDGGAIVGHAQGQNVSILGVSEGPAPAVHGHSTQTTQTSFGVIGTVGPSPFVISATLTGGVGVVGNSQSGDGVAGIADGVGSVGNGVEGLRTNGQGAGLHGTGSGATSVGVFATNTGTGQAARFIGDVGVQGQLTASGKAFRIDHPVDPEHKYLTHCSVESPEMLTVYNGVTTTGDDGEAVVKLPDYFEALNRDFTYQLTVIREFAQAIISREIEGNYFSIRTDRPRVKVSWQVTGIRHDRFAEAHRVVVEQEKSEADRGRYLHPELYESRITGPDNARPIGHIEALLGGPIVKRNTEVDYKTGPRRE